MATRGGERRHQGRAPHCSVKELAALVGKYLVLAILYVVDLAFLLAVSASILIAEPPSGPLLALVVVPLYLLPIMAALWFYTLSTSILEATTYMAVIVGIYALLRSPSLCPKQPTASILEVAIDVLVLIWLLLDLLDSLRRSATLVVTYARARSCPVPVRDAEKALLLAAGVAALWLAYAHVMAIAWPLARQLKGFICAP